MSSSAVANLISSIISILGLALIAWMCLKDNRDQSPVYLHTYDLRSRLRSV